MKKVAIIMGSDSDFPVVSKAVSKLKEFGVEYEVHVMSAHRTPDAAIKFSAEAKKNGFGVIIDGMDALLATVMMPTGIPVATVAVDGAANAAILAVEMLALSDDSLAEKLENMKADMEKGVAEKDKAMQAKVAEL